MPYHSQPLSEAEIDALPLRFVKLEQGEQETFTDVLLQVWFALAESGSLATLPPVPDIVSFADDCAFFYLIFHTNPSQLGLENTSSPLKASSSKPRLSPNKRPHPYAHARPQAHSPEPEPTVEEVIGCVYLSYAPSAQDTLDLGVALRPEARTRGYGRATITKFLRLAFESLHAHRVVANVFGPSEVNQQQSARESGSVRWIFEKLGFVPEGVQRRAAFSPAEGIWRDVYPLAMLDIDWVRLASRRPEGRTGITCPFEAMVERHTAEQEQMTEWMDDPSWGRLKRVSSTETIKGRSPSPVREPSPPARSPSPIQSEFSFAAPSESSFSVPSEHDWRSPTPSDYSVVPEMTPPFSISPSPPASVISLTDSEPALIGSTDLDPPLSPGFSTAGETIELAHFPPLSAAPYVARPPNVASSSYGASSPPYVGSPPPYVASSPYVTSSPLYVASSPARHVASSPSPHAASSPAPYIIGPMPNTPQDGDEPLDFWPSDSEFDGSISDRG